MPLLCYIANHWSLLESFQTFERWPRINKKKQANYYCETACENSMSDIIIGNNIKISNKFEELWLAIESQVYNKKPNCLSCLTPGIKSIRLYLIPNINR